MAMTDTSSTLPGFARLRDLAPWRRLCGRIAKARSHRHFLRSVEGLEPHLIRDVGLDPEHVRRMVAQDRLCAWWRLE
jgi:hypothetical protein